MTDSFPVQGADLALKTRVQCFVAAVSIWLLAALSFAILQSRPSALAIVPIAIVLFYASRIQYFTQSVQLVWPVLLLAGSVLCFIGVMQSMNYGRMDNEPDVQHISLRLAFFAVGLFLHAAAFWFVATESRASDHPSGARAERI
ncbi:MAG: hypothetical protein EAZ43_05080 [Betaproteobacteria bacterium]|nr:MAG: hypothetical protein EAZ43_05080 [Betaproteobacteria bacterium]